MQEFSLAAVPHRQRSVTPQALPLGAADGRAAKHFAILRFVHLRQPLQRWIDEGLARLKFRGAGHGCFAIPRTDVLADIAAKHMPPQFFTHGFRNRTSLLDSQIGNAQVRIQLIRSDQRVSRTGVDTAHARAATIRRRQVWRQLEGCEDHAEKQPRSQLLMDGAGIFARPADARVLCVNAIGQRTGIDITTSRNAVVRNAIQARPQRSLHLPQPPQDRIVIILPAPGIAGNPPPGCIPAFRRVRMGRIVVCRTDNDAPSPRCHPPQRTAFQIAGVVACRHVLHFSAAAGCNPFFQLTMLGKVSHGRDPRQFETRATSRRKDGLFRGSKVAPSSVIAIHKCSILT